MIRIRVNNSRSSLGGFRFLKGVMPKHRKVEQCLISITDRLDLPQSELDDILIHEMIHYYIWINGIEDSSTHGRVFRQMMADINARHRRNIKISTRLTKEVAATDQKLKHHYICLLTLTDGRRAVTLCARSRIFDIYRGLKEWDIVQKMEWYWSSDPWWNRYRRSLKAKAYSIDMAEAAPHLLAATPCECDDKIFRPKKRS